PNSISYHQWIEIDRLARLALLLRSRLRDGERARLEMLAALRPGQRRVVLRITGLADVDDHVPQCRSLGRARDEILFEEVPRRSLQLLGRHLLRAIARHEAPARRMLGALRVDELERMNAEVSGLIEVRGRLVSAVVLPQSQRVGMRGGIGLQFFRVGLARPWIRLRSHERFAERGW